MLRCSPAACRRSQGQPPSAMAAADTRRDGSSGCSTSRKPAAKRASVKSAAFLRGQRAQCGCRSLLASERRSRGHLAGRRWFHGHGRRAPFAQHPWAAPGPCSDPGQEEGRAGTRHQPGSRDAVTGASLRSGREAPHRLHTPGGRAGPGRAPARGGRQAQARHLVHGQHVRDGGRELVLARAQVAGRLQAARHGLQRHDVRRRAAAVVRDRHHACARASAAPGLRLGARMHAAARAACLPVRTASAGAKARGRARRQSRPPPRPARALGRRRRGSTRDSQRRAERARAPAAMYCTTEMPKCSSRMVCRPPTAPASSATTCRRPQRAPRRPPTRERNFASLLL